MTTRYENLPIDSLFIDPTYQRKTNFAKVTKWTKDFDEAMLRALEVAARPNGRYAILDGGHRWHMLIAKNWTYAPCLVHPPMTVEEESKMFKALNCTLNRVSLPDQFWAMIASKDARCVEILKAVQKYGLTIARHSTGSREQNPDQICAVGALLRIERHHGLGILDNAISFAREIWPGNAYILKGEVLEGIAIFLHRHKDNPDFSLKTSKKKLSVLDTEVVLAQAKRNYKMFGTYVQSNIAEILTASYNKGLSPIKKLPWREE